MTDNRREIFCATDTPYRPIRNIKQTTSRDIFYNETSCSRDAFGLWLMSLKTVSTPQEEAIRSSSETRLFEECGPHKARPSATESSNISKHSLGVRLEVLYMITAENGA